MGVLFPEILSILDGMTSGELYRLLYEISARNLFDGYEEYIRTEVSLLTVFSNSFSLWLSIFSGFKLVTYLILLFHLHSKTQL